MFLPNRVLSSEIIAVDKISTTYFWFPTHSFSSSSFYSTQQCLGIPISQQCFCFSELLFLFLHKVYVIIDTQTEVIIYAKCE